jgi:hypothetical protein
MTRKTHIGGVPIDYECARLTPADVERIKMDPRKSIYDYTFDQHDVLTSDIIAAKVRFVYLEAVRMHRDDSTTTKEDVERRVLEADTTLESFKTTHPRVFSIVCDPHASQVDLVAITRMLDLKRQQENGRSEASVLADVEKAVIHSANQKRKETPKESV